MECIYTVEVQIDSEKFVICKNVGIRVYINILE